MMKDTRSNLGRKIGRPRRDEACMRGHVRTPENTYTRPNGYRECLICKKTWRSRAPKTQEARDLPEPRREPQNVDDPVQWTDDWDLQEFIEGPDGA